MPFAVLDTYPEFLRYWRDARGQPIERQIEGWRAVYLAPWPELAALQTADYAEQGLDWREVGRQRIFPTLDERLPDMCRAHDGLLACLARVDAQARRALCVDLGLSYVIHVGLGCGAGWATTFAGRPAVLFGLENAAEEGWVDEESLERLVAHEFGHLAHRHWRQSAGLGEGRGPWWQLIEEGIARRCEHHVLGRGNPSAAWLDEGWEAWCEEHRSWLAQEYLDTIRRGEPVNRFFGSWHEIGGRSQTGYFLGERVVREWERDLDLAEIARLGEATLEVRSRESLEAMARLAGGSGNPGDERRGAGSRN